MNIIGLFPLTGNGGIASWTKTYLSSFPDDEFHIIPVNVTPDDRHDQGMYGRIISGLSAIVRIKKEIKTIIREQRIDVLHTTTSGNIGSLRDIVVARFCRQNGIKTIMHCRYGCIPEDFQDKGLVGQLLRKSVNLYDQIWVLDQRTYSFLQTINTLKNKVFLTPNSIEVKERLDETPKYYKRIAFVGNLVPTKGLFELTKAVLQCDARLDIIGPGRDEVNKRLQEIVGNELNKKIFIHGKLPNNEAVKFMHDVDMIALPTYYPSEAFPISILEAMSLTKMVISCPRAAVPDMLTDLEGKPCGMLVPEKSVQDIVDAINWCQNHTEEADRMCRQAYEKVYACYRKEIIYNIYRTNYRQLLKEVR